MSDKIVYKQREVDGEKPDFAVILGRKVAKLVAEGETRGRMGGWADAIEHLSQGATATGHPELSFAAEYLAGLGVPLPETALSAPSEPVPDGPRVWAMPEWPSDWKAFEDAQGFVWRLDEADDRWKRSTGAWTDDPLRMIFEHPYLAPLTEVVEEATPCGIGRHGDPAGCGPECRT